MTMSLWEDEMYTANHYVSHGFANIFDPTAYISNNHPLYSVLSTLDTTILGNNEVILRIGSVVPATIAVTLVAYWLWTHHGQLTTIIFIFLITVSPLHFDAFRQARGWGLASLGAAIVLVASLTMQRDERITGRHIAWFIVGSLIGIWTIYPLLLPFAAHGAILLISRRERGKLTLMAGTVAVASILFYWPLRSALVDPAAVRGRAGTAAHARDGFVTLSNVAIEPVNRLVRPIFELTLPAGIALLLACALVIAGMASLVRARHWTELMHLVLPGAMVFVGLAVRQAGIWDRYVSYLLLPILALTALGGSMLWSLASAPLSRGVAAITVAALCVAIGVGFGRFASPIVSVPIEDFKGAAAVVDSAAPLKAAVTDRALSSFRYYLHKVELTKASPEDFVSRSCTQAGPAVFIDYPRRSSPVDASCLAVRGVRLTLRQRRDPPITIWLVP